MSTGFRFTWSGIFLLSAILAAMIVHEIRQTGRASAALELAHQRNEQARQRVARAEQTLARDDRERVDHPAGVSAAAGTPDVHAADANGGRAEGAGATAELRMRRLRPEVAEATDPTLRALCLQVFDAHFEGTWGPVLRQLNLPEGKVAALQLLLRAHEERRMDVTAVAGEQGLELSDPAIQRMRRTDGTRLAEEVQALLGPDDARIFQRFRGEMGVMAQVSGIAEATYHTGTPLTYAESEQLRSILAAHSERMPNGFVRPNSVNGEAALAQIATSSAFSAATVEAFRRQVADAQMHRQIDQRQDEIGTQIMGSAGAKAWPYLPALQPRP